MSTSCLRPRAVDFHSVWPRIERSIMAIMRLEKLDRRVWDDNFYDIYLLCIAVPETLAHQLYQSLKNCLVRHVRGLQQLLRAVPDEGLLQEYCGMWKIYYEASGRIHSLFGYLNRQHVAANYRSDLHPVPELEEIEPNMKEVGHLALEIWLLELLYPLGERIIKQLLYVVEDERKRITSVPPKELIDTVHSFIELDSARYLTKVEHDRTCEAYYTLFEPAYLAATKEYYKTLSIKMVSELSITDYIANVRKLIDAEESRAKAFLHKCTLDANILSCYAEVVETHKDALLSISNEYIKDEKIKDLQTLYSLLKPLPKCLNILVSEFEKYVKNVGHEAIDNLAGENLPQQFFDIILQIFNRFRNLLTNVFNDDGEFTNALDKALHAIVNHRGKQSEVPKAAELLAKFIDNLFRKLARIEANTDQILENCIVVFRYIDEKDIFQRYYQRMLSNRLIYHISCMDIEQSMINRLRKACGYEFTSKISRMYTDMGSSKDLTNKFIQHIKANKIELHVPLSVSILQSGMWPFAVVSLKDDSPTTSTSFNLPKVLTQSLARFEDFYLQKYNGRKLTWYYNLSTVDMRLNCFHKPYFTTINAHQCAVLLCFEKEDALKMKKIQESIGLQNELLVRTIRTLFESGLFTCLTEVDNWDEDTEFALNFDLKSRRARIKIPMPQTYRQPEREKEMELNTIQLDRKYFMECVIVRVMKERKVLQHTQLVQEILKSTEGRFIPDTAFIKKGIESLIDRQYIQRTDKQDEYQYLA